MRKVAESLVNQPSCFRIAEGFCRKFKTAFTNRRCLCVS
jgi:hypothetical protein